MSSLNYYCLVEIFAHLDVKQLGRCGQVCKLWSQAANELLKRPWQRQVWTRTKIRCQRISKDGDKFYGCGPKTTLLGGPYLLVDRGEIYALRHQGDVLKVFDAEYPFEELREKQLLDFDKWGMRMMTKCLDRRRSRLIRGREVPMAVTPHHLAIIVQDFVMVLDRESLQEVRQVEVEGVISKTKLLDLWERGSRIKAANCKVYAFQEHEDVEKPPPCPIIKLDELGIFRPELHSNALLRPEDRIIQCSQVTDAHLLLLQYASMPLVLFDLSSGKIRWEVMPVEESTPTKAFREDDNFDLMLSHKYAVRATRIHFTVSLSRWDIDVWGVSSGQLVRHICHTGRENGLHVTDMTLRALSPHSGGLLCYVTNRVGNRQSISTVVVVDLRTGEVLVRLPSLHHTYLASEVAFPCADSDELLAFFGRGFTHKLVDLPMPSAKLREADHSGMIDISDPDTGLPDVSAVGQNRKLAPMVLPLEGEGPSDVRWTSICLPDSGSFLGTHEGSIYAGFLVDDPNPNSDEPVKVESGRKKYFRNFFKTFKTTREK